MGTSRGGRRQAVALEVWRHHGLVIMPGVDLGCVVVCAHLEPPFAALPTRLPPVLAHAPRFPSGRSSRVEFLSADEHAAYLEDRDLGDYWYRPPQNPDLAVA